ncbi:MAG: cytotoxic translational repressor of toxin-antitoxin stability system [Treponema sp.]|nr:MAG: cytotoxic translational repressor of toxin-antitoxin stability system [Treponema sp.]
MKVQWSKKSLKQLRKLPESEQEKIYIKGSDLKNFPNVDNVIHLTNHKYNYRLRVGNYRILFNFKSVIKVISIEEVKKRNEGTY